MNFIPLIEAKRDGGALEAAQVREVIRALTAGEIPDYQMAAFLMAVCFRGLNHSETTALTLAMRDSGDLLRFPADTRPLVDKHSTGGVGDKVSLPLAPLLASLDFRVPMLSGRGLGITGGTLDKLESLPGFQAQLPAERIVETVQRVGCVICGQTDRMVPADRKLYALRDVTGTVPSIPLIVASILSKKLAEGIEALVLDVKFGTAAFMNTLERARELGQAMVALGNDCGVNTRALLTRMDIPLGRAAGNWLEVKEAVECLENRGPADVRTIVIACAARLLLQTGKVGDLDQGRRTAEDCLASGKPRKKWDEMLVAQGVDLEATNRLLASDYRARAVLELKADHDGFVSHCDAKALGELIRDLGGGRVLKDSAFDHSVGVDRLGKPGEMVRAGDLLGRIHAATRDKAEEAFRRLAAAFSLSDAQLEPKPLIADEIT